MDILSLSVGELSRGLKDKQFSSVDITKAYLDAIEKDKASSEPINAYISVYPELALQQAKQADQLIQSGKATTLTGVPIAIKDNINIKGLTTTCASHILNGYHASYDAGVIDRLVHREGMVVLGKTNMDEFAMGSSTETSYYGITRNPVDKNRIPGGSSGGSAAAVGGRLAPIALGSDTGGSIRQPASLCGIVGMKPTYGRVSRYGLVAFASSLDQIGSLSRTVEDGALLLQAMSGHDGRDSTSLELEYKPSPLNSQVKGLKIGLPKEFFIDGMDAAVEKNIKATIDLLKQQGAEIVEISLPHTKYAVATYYIVATAEASSNLERFDGVKYGHRAETQTLSDLYLHSRSEGFGEEVKRRIMLGTYVLSAGYYDAYYLKALKVRTLIKNDFEEAFKKVDVILGPTAPTTAFKIGEKLNDPISMYLSDIFTISVNLAGLPAISVPSGKDNQGLPIGTQIIGRLLDEQTVLNTALAVQNLQGV